MLRDRLARWALVVLWMALIFALSAQSALPSVPDALPDFLLKKSAHAVEYAVLAVLLLRALYPAANPALRLFLFPLLIAVLYAIGDELHQALTPQRHPTLLDVAVDTAGAVAGLVLYSLRSHRSR